MSTDRLVRENEDDSAPRLDTFLSVVLVICCLFKILQLQTYDRLDI